MGINCNHPTCIGECRRKKNKKKAYFIPRMTKKTAKKKREQAKITKKDHEIYAQIWEEREHIDFETGEPIFGEYSTIYFHHVLFKSKYKQYRHKKWNIVLVSWNTHSKFHNSPDLCPKIKQYGAELQDKISGGELL